VASRTKSTINARVSRFSIVSNCSATRINNALLLLFVDEFDIAVVVDDEDGDNEESVTLFDDFV
jgi:hypothetical protein